MKFPIRLQKVMWCSAICLALAPAVCAGEEAATEDRVALDPIVVVASKMAQPLSAVAAQVTVIEAQDLRRALVEDIDGMLKYEPGLDLESSGTRFGGTSVNIRGIAGNRVNIEVDGVPVRDQFIIGAYSNAGRTLVEPDRVKRVEVLHGPGSVMYGSDALGGVLAVSTWDPSDLLAGTGSTSWLGLRGGYQGMDSSWVGSGVSAVGAGPHGLLLAATWRNGHELDRQAPNQMAADDQDWDSRDYAFRYTFDTPGDNRLRLSADRWERDTDTRIESLLGYGTRFRSTTELLGDDHDENRRLSADYDFATDGGIQGVVRAYDTHSNTDQWTYEQRAASAKPVSIQRHFVFDQQSTGAEAFAFREFAVGDSQHRFGLGAEWIGREVSELRDGLQTSLVDGSSTHVILGEEFPVRDFPESSTDEYSLWVQDEIRLADGRWELTPGLRWDSYELDPQPDSIWREDNPDTEVVAVSEDRATPRLGVLYRVNPQWTLYGQYAEGFRAPPYEDANIGFDIPLFGFRAIPNPDLQSETSSGFEFGVRRFNGSGRFSLTLFRTDYDDFIESRVLIGRDPTTGDLIFQSRNIDRARITGVDLRFVQDLAAWAEAMRGWSLEISAYWAEGDNRQSGAPLNSVAPPQAVIGLSWASPDDTWDVAVSATLTAAKHQDDIDSTVEPRFATPGWTTFDLSAGWRPTPRVELRAGVFNVTDQAYWRWLDVANLEAANPMIPLLSRPGRNFSLSAAYSF